METRYLRRSIESEYLKLAKNYPVVTLTGPRQSGKTTLCKKLFPQLPYVNLEQLDIRQQATEDPRGFLDSYRSGAIIDEIQRTPDLPSFIQPVVDADDFSGLFILTGSQNFAVSQTVNQSLAGRTAVLTLLPFSIQETQQEKPWEEFIYSGFYPRIYQKNLNPTRVLSDYVATYVERDLRQLSMIKDLSLFQAFMQSCASRIGQLLNIQSLCNDLGIRHKTAEEWFTLLEASYILFRLRPFHRNVGKRLVKSPKIYFHDVGLASFLVGIEGPHHVKSHPLKGALFENLVASEALKYFVHSARRPNLLFYRDSNGNEVDFILESNARVVLIEAKCGKTISKDQFKGFENFSKLGMNVSKKILVYGGAENREIFGTSVVPVAGVTDSLLI